MCIRMARAMNQQDCSESTISRPPPLAGRRGCSNMSSIFEDHFYKHKDACLKRAPAP